MLPGERLIRCLRHRQANTLSAFLIADRPASAGHCCPPSSHQPVFDFGIQERHDFTELPPLPLNARNFQQLAVLAAGTSTAIRNKDQAGGFYSHGQHTGQNNFILDGVDNNSYVMGLQDNKAQVVIPALDAIQEFKLETSNFSAEFGANAGSVMIVSVRSGTNSIHGTAYEYLRNDKFDARPTFGYVDRNGDGRADPDVLPTPIAADTIDDHGLWAQADVWFSRFGTRRVGSGAGATRPP